MFSIFNLTYFGGNISNKSRFFVYLASTCASLYYLINHQNKVNIENMTSDEAIKNVASIFNTDNLAVKNIVATGKTTHSGGVWINGGSTSIPAAWSGGINVVSGENSPVSGEMLIGDGTGWQFKIGSRSGSTTTPRYVFNDSGDLTINGSLTVNGPITATSMITGQNLKTGGTVTTVNVNASGNITGGSTTVNGDLIVTGKTNTRGGLASGQAGMPNGGQSICRKSDGSWTNIGSCGW